MTDTLFFKIENTTIRIHTNYCLKTKEEVDIKLKNIGEIYADYLKKEITANSRTE